MIPLPHEIDFLKNKEEIIREQPYVQIELPIEKDQIQKKKEPKHVYIINLCRR